ncbi:MAG: hypothetical protein ACREXT_18775, partial [Gammaproteobacteria bacterium]
ALPKASPPSSRADSAPAVDYQLRAIKIDRSHTAAIINDELVAEGSTVDGARVLKITPAAVVIKVGAAATTLRLNPHVIKQPSAIVP